MQPPPPLTHSSIPKKFLKISKEFDNFVCIFPGVSYGLQVSCKAVSCFEGCVFEEEKKQ